MTGTEVGSHPFQYAPQYTSDDGYSHEPTPDQNWQESAVLVYADPESGVAGYQRIGAFVNKAEGDVYSWTQVSGKNVSRAMLTGLALPPGPVTDTTLAGVTFETIEPTNKVRLTVDRDSVMTDVVFESYTGPAAWPMDQAGAKMASGHYESVGSVKGSIVADGTTYTVNGVGYIDHSWGPRDLSTVYSCRWMMMDFDADNHLNAWPLIGADGLAMHGYIVLDGELAYVKKIESELRVGSDQLHLNGGRYVITDTMDRTVELSATAVGEHSIQPFGQALFAVHQPAVFEGMGRQGRGIIEWTPPKAIPTEELKAMNMDRENKWLHISSA